MNKWKSLYLAQSLDVRLVLAAIALALVPILAIWLFRHPEAPSSDEPAAPVDTHIPRGFVLVPIEADNHEALDSILGRFGWVDLFEAGAEGRPRTLVARNVRLLRAPHNPAHFAVLVPEKDSARILRGGGVFTVVVKRRGESGTEFVDDRQRSAPAVRRQITYEGE